MNEKSINSKLDEIIKLLLKSKINNISFLLGLSGINIALYYQYKNNEQIIIKNIGKVISEINKGFSIHTYCSGISGFAWSLKHLIYKGFFDEKDCEILNQINPFIYKKMLNDLENKNFDFLHGAIGVGLYFISDLNNKSSLAHVSELVDKIEDLSIKDGKGILKWESLVIGSNNNLKLVYNLSLSHGMASIIAFLAKTYQKGINKTKSKKILVSAINYLLKNKNDISKYNCYFPSWICNTDENRQSRLAWCYGDLGISVALYNAAKVLNDTSLEEFALKVLHHSSCRRDLPKEFVIDAGLCHGTAGIAHIFYRMYWNTKDKAFYETANFWFEKTLEMSNFSNGLAGYKAYRSKENGSWQKEYGILEGISGISLALHSWVTQTEPTWDECLLLS